MSAIYHTPKNDEKADTLATPPRQNQESEVLE